MRMTVLQRGDAARAIYIDFECLKTDPPHPALLGILTGDSEDVEQLIVDERLAPARVAKAGRTRVVTPADAVDTIVNMARSDGRHIVGWSYFDRDRLIEARPDLTDDIRAVYVNALLVARPWRRTVYPAFAIEREDDYAPWHTLDKYAVLAGYPQARKLSGEPARWIRHILQQLKVTQGNYRKTPEKTKAQWHKLLDYNRHDLLALRLIVRRASRELELWRSYERTRFCVNDGDRRICFMAGSQNRKLDALLSRRNARRWAFITAWNPASEPLPAATNAKRHAELVRVVTDLGFEILPGQGIGEDPEWAPEESLLIFGISRGKAQTLGRRFGQLAIVVGRRGEKCRLLSTASIPSVSVRRQLRRRRGARLAEVSR